MNPFSQVGKAVSQSYKNENFLIQSNSYNNEDIVTTGATYLLPSSLIRTFRDEAPEEESDVRVIRVRAKRRPARQREGQQFRRQFRRPEGVPGYLGAGSYLPVGFNRRRTVVDNSAIPSSVPVIEMVPIVTNPIQAPLQAASNVVPVQTELLADAVVFSTSPASLEGWLSYPTEAPKPAITKNKLVQSGTSLSFMAQLKKITY